jgi:hypothetical protein
MVRQNDHFAPSTDLRVFSSRSRFDSESFNRFGGWRLPRGLSGGKPPQMLVISILSWHDYFTYQTCMLTTHMKYILELCEPYFVKMRYE